MQPHVALVAGAALLLAGAAAAGQSPLGIIEIDKPFPELELPSLDGGQALPVDSLFKGKRTVLVVFASW